MNELFTNKMYFVFLSIGACELLQIIPACSTSVRTYSCIQKDDVRKQKYSLASFLKGTFNGVKNAVDGVREPPGNIEYANTYLQNMGRSGIVFPNMNTGNFVLYKPGSNNYNNNNNANNNPNNNKKASNITYNLAFERNKPQNDIIRSDGGGKNGPDINMQFQFTRSRNNSKPDNNEYVGMEIPQSAITVQQRIIEYLPVIYTSIVERPPIYYRMPNETVVLTAAPVTVTTTKMPLSYMMTPETIIKEAPPRTMYVTLPNRTIFKDPVTMTLKELVEAAPKTFTSTRTIIPSPETKIVQAPPVLVTASASTMYITKTLIAPPNTMVVKELIQAPASTSFVKIAGPTVTLQPTTVYYPSTTVYVIDPERARQQQQRPDERISPYNVPVYNSNNNPGNNNPGNNNPGINIPGKVGRQMEINPTVPLNSNGNNSGNPNNGNNGNNPNNGNNSNNVNNGGQFCTFNKRTGCYQEILSNNFGYEPNCTERRNVAFYPMICRVYSMGGRVPGRMPGNLERKNIGDLILQFLRNRGDKSKENEQTEIVYLSDLLKQS